MSVDLTKLPEPLPCLKRFNIWFWAILFLVFVASGILVTFIFSLFFPITNLLFIFSALILPFVVWIFVFLYALYYRGYRETYIKQWNEQREQRRNELVNHARRGLYVLDYSLITAYGLGNNANGVVTNQYSIAAKRPINGGVPIAHSALDLPSGMSCYDFDKRIENIFIQWQQKYRSKLNELPTNLNIHVRLFIDTPIAIENIENIWLKTLGKTVKSTSFNIEDPKGSTKFFEEWLDHSEYDQDLLLTINLHLFDQPINGEAESAVILLLAGEQAILNQYLIISEPSVVKIFRSEQTSSFEQTINNTLLWAMADDKPYDGVWYSGVSVEQNIEIMNHFNRIEFEHGEIFNIDTSIGYTQDSAYFLAMALAVEHALETKNKQLIIIGQPKATASVVTTITKK